MATQNVTSLPGSYPDSPTSVTSTTLDTTDGNVFTLTGGEIIRLEHTGTGGTDASITVVSVDTAGTNRTEDITLTMSDGDVEILGPMSRDGWRDSNGELTIDGDNAEVEIEVYRD